MDEETFILWLCTALNITGVFVALLLQFLKAEYGRYFNKTSQTKWGLGMNAKLAWFVQELPMFVLPLFFLFKSYNAYQAVNPNNVLICFILIHYFRR